MRRFILSILLAGAAATPALAQEHGRWQQDEAKGDRAQTHEERQQQREQAREQRSGATDVAPPQQQVQQPQAQPDRTPRFEMRQGAGGGSDRRRFDNNVQTEVQAAPQPEPQRQFDGRRRFEDRNNVQTEVQVQPQPEQQRQADSRDRSGRTRDGSNWTGNGEAQSGTGNGGWTHRGDLRQSDRPLPNVMRDRNPLIVSQTPREGTQPPLRTESRRHWGNNQSGNWSGNWRHDRRYDWHSWRNRHRSTFRVGIYYDPFGWNYRPYQIGWRLWPSYYSRNNWINDPWQYRLPYAPPGTVWVRYWDDALLVDTYTGEVVDVIRDFFW